MEGKNWFLMVVCRNQNLDNDIELNHTDYYHHVEDVEQKEMGKGCMGKVERGFVTVALGVADLGM